MGYWPRHNKRVAFGMCSINKMVNKEEKALKRACKKDAKELILRLFAFNIDDEFIITLFKRKYQSFI